MVTISQVITVDGEKVRYDAGSDDVGTAEGFYPPGIDAPPLPGDDMAMVDGPGTGEQTALGYSDGTTKKSAGGEFRAYSRDSGGAVAAELHMKGDGTVTINDGSDMVALASLVEALIQGIIDAITNAIPAGGSSDGGTALQTSIVGSLSSLVVDVKSKILSSD